VLSRLHAATKPQIFGLMVITADVAVNNFSVGTVTLVVAIIVFQALTAPMAAHLVARAAYDTHHLRTDLLVVDELAPVAGRIRGNRDR
jgi:multicomponent Na+:H+ antiporter subunit G